MTLLLSLWVLWAWNPDAALYTWVQTHLQSPVAEQVALGLTRSADKPALALMGATYTGYALSRQEYRKAWTFAAVGFANAGTVTLIKGMVNRPRPLGPSPSRWNSSFPSGHAAAAFYLATYWGEEWPRYRVPLYLWAAGVAWSRVYLQRHWPSDVLVGATLGIAFGRLARWLLVVSWP